MLSKLRVSDEIWNFQNIVKLFNGFEIYKDANIITTPLFFYIGVLFCKIFGLNLLTFRMYDLLLIVTLVLLVYKIFKILEISKLKSLIYTLVIYIIAIILGTAGANYNVLVIIFFIIGLLLSIKKFTFKQKTYNILQGIIIFLIFLTKQNIAVYYTIGLLLSELFMTNKNYKTFVKSMLEKIIIAVIFISIYLVILYFNGKLNNFINYTILGIPEFSSNFFFGIESIKNIGIICIISVVGIMAIFKKNNAVYISSKMRNNIIILLSFGICMEFTAYPIFNLYHTMLGGYIIYILGFYLLDIIFIDNLNKIKKYLVFTAVILLTIFLIFSLIMLILYISFDRCEEIKVYKNIIVDKDLKEDILNVDRYIKYKESLGIKVVIFSGDAALYMVPLNKSNGNIDLPFLGNMGANGETRMLEKLNGLKNTEILIVKDEEDVFRQESKLIRKYIMQHYMYKRRNRKI
jgi:4-amino-4-deoxy-L-arabinose transferase-like glycosyltransferase